jgi:hypothetical protein
MSLVFLATNIKEEIKKNGKLHQRKFIFVQIPFHESE